jgi:uncharacterized protein YndB with AHSA1/START domain
MTKRSITHATFVVERTYSASPARVFNAFADPKAKAVWFGGPDDWDTTRSEMDFRVGGRDVDQGGPKGGFVSTYEATYQDIVQNERIITTYVMHLDGNKISVSLATVEFTPEGTGTRLVLTEMGAYLDGWDKPDQREHGTRELLDNLGRYLQVAK